MTVMMSKLIHESLLSGGLYELSNDPIAREFASLVQQTG